MSPFWVAVVAVLCLGHLVPVLFSFPPGECLHVALQCWPPLRSSLGMALDSGSRPKLLYVVPGLGESARLHIVSKNVQAFRAQLGAAPAFDFECLVYMYKRVEPDAEAPLPCSVQDFSSSPSRMYWTHFMKRVPEAVVAARTHVVVGLDDVDATNVDLMDFVNAMERNDLSVLSPSIIGAHQASMYPDVEHLTGRLVDYIEPNFMIFRSRAFLCWQDLIDLRMNPVGWGYDQLLHSMCGVRMGILDRVPAFHGNEKVSGTAFANMDVARMERRIFTGCWEARGYRAVPYNNNTEGMGLNQSVLGYLV